MRKKVDSKNVAKTMKKSFFYPVTFYDLTTRWIARKYISSRHQLTGRRVKTKLLGVIQARPGLFFQKMLALGDDFTGVVVFLTAGYLCTHCRLSFNFSTGVYAARNESIATEQHLYQFRVFEKRCDATADMLWQQLDPNYSAQVVRYSLRLQRLQLLAIQPTTMHAIGHSLR